MTERGKCLAIAAAAALIAFAIGATWQNMNARSYAEQLAQLEPELRFQRLQATLGAATVEAQRGSYEIARQLASDFFGGLQNDIASATPEQLAPLEEILQQRDAMITALSRSDPQSGAMFASLFIRLRIAMGETVGPSQQTVPSTGM